ncbi:MAG TPA: hypothetical protein VIJ33_00215 [Solirubrobacteraceae bacterium]
MTATGKNLEDKLLLDRELWEDGPPHALFKELRQGCPVHWTKEIDEYPDEGGFWSVTTAEDVHTVSRDWQTYSSELGGVTVLSTIFPLEETLARFPNMEVAGRPLVVESAFLNQLKTLPVRLNP